MKKNQSYSPPSKAWPEKIAQGQRQVEIPETKMERPEPWPSLLQEYSQATTMHGARYIGETSTAWLRRLFWLVLLMACAGFFVYYAYIQIAKYISFPMITDSVSEYKSSATLPAVTVCNQNKYRITAASERDWYGMLKAVVDAGKGTVKHTCADDEFSCKDGSCVLPGKRCDLFPDCHDGSDEEQCERCPLLQLMSESAHLSDLRSSYFLQVRNSQNQTYYMLDQHSRSVYLLHNATHWTLGSAYDDDALRAVAPSSLPSPDDVPSATWRVSASGQLVPDATFSLKCAQRNSDVLIPAPQAPTEGLQLEQLVNNTKHKQSDFIAACWWRGLPCSPAAVQPSKTDMGVCYTFNNPATATDEKPMDIDQSGPGYGLKLSINIEFYEYMKDSQAGLGVKLLLHDAGDFPMVDERGVSVSPGLISYISVETTEVMNLPPPYGICGEADLEYFPGQYSLSRCKVNRETSHVAELCGCRDSYMPDGSGALADCDVRQFVDCLAPTLVALRSDSNQTADCPTPCHRLNVVPTTSFSIMKGPSETARDDKTRRLQQRLTAANEVTYRLVTDKKISSLRTFHLLDSELVQMSLFVSNAIHSTSYEFTKVKSVTSAVNADCIWIRNELRAIRGDLKRKIVDALHQFHSLYQSQAIWPLQDFFVAADGRLAAPEQDDYFLHINDTDREFSAILRNLQYLKRDPYVSAVASIGSVDQRPHVRIDGNVLANFARFVHNGECPHCVGTSGLVGRLVSRFSEDLRVNMVNVAAYEQQFIRLYYDQLRGLVADSNRTQAQMAAYQLRRDDLLARFRLESTRLKSTVSDALAAATFVGHVVDFLWTQNCQSMLHTRFSLIESGDSQLTELLTQMRDYLSLHRNTLASIRSSYLDKKTRLIDVPKQFVVADVESESTRMQTRLENSFNNRIQHLKDLRDQLVAVQYLMVALIDKSKMAATSEYWKMFSLSSIEPLPASDTSSPWPSLRTSPTAVTERFWSDLSVSVSRLLSDMRMRGESLAQSLRHAEQFFSEYQLANELNEQFYTNNFLVVDVHFKELVKRSVTQTEAYKFDTLLSNIGGIMGLLIGASALTLVEIVDFFFYNSIRKCAWAGRKRPPVRPQNVRQTYPAQ